MEREENASPETLPNPPNTMTSLQSSLACFALADLAESFACASTRAAYQSIASSYAGYRNAAKALSAIGSGDPSAPNAWQHQRAVNALSA